MCLDGRSSSVKVESSNFVPMGQSNRNPEPTSDGLNALQSMNHRRSANLAVGRRPRAGNGSIATPWLLNVYALLLEGNISQQFIRLTNPQYLPYLETVQHLAHLVQHTLPPYVFKGTRSFEAHTLSKCQIN